MRAGTWLALALGVALAGCSGGEQGGETGAETGAETADTSAAGGAEPGLAIGVGSAAQARTVLLNAQGDTVGTATLREEGDAVRISVQVAGLEPGPHGIHIHETGRCEAPAFTSAGGHLNPQGRQHGLENPQGAHAGDLPNLEVGEDGTAQQELTTDRLGTGDDLFDVDGSALVVHARRDDQRTDPSGDSGDRVACGAITRGE